MVAAPQYGFAKFIGRSKKVYTVDIYASDVANAEINFDSGTGAGTGSRTFWSPPEDCVLVDFAIHTGMTDTTVVRVTKGGAPTGNTMRYAAHLDTSNARPELAIGFKEGINVGLIQLA